jgi:transposase
LTTKIHALVDAEGRPVALALTAGQTHDSIMAEPMLADLKPGAILLADKAYDTNALRALADSRKAWANIPAKRTRKETFAFSSWVYRQRNLVERFFNKLKQLRGIATRYDKDPLNFLASQTRRRTHLDQSVMSLRPNIHSDYYGSDRSSVRSRLGGVVDRSGIASPLRTK